jgi:alkaline phosphatase D
MIRTINKFITGLALSLLPALSHAAIVAYWSFDDDFNADVGGSAYNLTASGNPFIQSGETALGSGAVNVYRNQNDYLFTSGDVVPSGQQDFSYSAWYFLDYADIQEGNRHFIMESTAGDSVSNTQSHPISYGLRDEGSGDVGEIYTSENNASSSNFQFSTTPNQAWHNIITTFDADSGTIIAYLDGVQVGSASGITDMDPGLGLVIGGHRNGTGRGFNGYIDEVAVYNTTLSSAQVTSLQTMTPVELFGTGSSVPEPSTVGLLLLGAAGLSGLRRRMDD